MLRHTVWPSYCIHINLWHVFLYTLCDIFHTIAKLQGSLQSKQLDLATVPVIVECCFKAQGVEGVSKVQHLV